MGPSPEIPEPSEYDDVDYKEGDDEWEAEAWVYFIWVVMGFRVYLKIGYSSNPASRYNQLITGIPERPYTIHLLACLNVKQARLFEGMLHEHLKDYRARGEWFTHSNVKHLHRVLRAKVWDILSLFRTFGYTPDLKRIDLDGFRPVLRENGYISHLVDPATEDDGEGG
ncbi:MAG TPA: GIY-YIG nuclease family protein [Chloroflexota bacterium]|nr:GIY-YIG nuclease family protein [Chloroflexota bacterium]HUM67519.1 GIY-YIG nuclease family protein [Chloroflexota bacterium]